MITPVLLSQDNTSGSTETDSYIIQKKNGQIILAYLAFNDFLNSDKSWNSYKSILLDPYPSMVKIHERQIEWGGIDTLKFKDDVRLYQKENFEKYMSQYDLDRINYLYDSIIELSHNILPPRKNVRVDLCFFLPYGGCFVVIEKSLCTICISMYIDPNEIEKIMAHEYSHILHIERAPVEPLTLQREIVSEGIAVYLTNQIIKDIKVSSSVPFMSESSFDWCLQNESMIKDSVKMELNDTTMRLYKRYISDGDFAEPPTGFVQKTGYFIGYRIIEACINKGMSLEEVCSLLSEDVVAKSEYFE